MEDVKLIEEVGRSLWGDAWQGPMGEALGHGTGTSLLEIIADALEGCRSRPSGVVLESSPSSSMICRHHLRGIARLLRVASCTRASIVAAAAWSSLKSRQLA